MPKFLIRMEATNFAWSCSDTQDLSTIRGGSMLLADAHVLIEEIAGIGTPEVHGASQAIWVIDVPDAQAAEAKRRAIEVALTTHASLKHGTFSVDVVAESGDAALDLQKLRTENRWRQFQRPTLAVPEPVDRPRGSERPYCQMDMVRPCADIIYKGKDRYTVSESVRDRRTYGRDQKKTILQEDGSS